MSFDKYEPPGLAYESSTTYGGDTEDASACVLSILELVPKRWRSKPVMELARIIAEEVCRTKASVDDLGELYSIDQTIEQMLPLLLEMWGLKVFPHDYSLEAKRRYVRFLIEAIQYKGTLFALELLAKGLLALDLVTVIDMGHHVLQTALGGGGYDSGRLAGPIEGEEALNRSSGHPYYSRLIGGEYTYGRVLLAIEARIDDNLSSIADRVRLLRKLVELFIPATVKWDVRITAYRVRDTVRGATDDVHRVDDFSWRANEEAFVPDHEPLVLSQSGTGGWTFHPGMPLLELELSSDDGETIHLRRWVGKLAYFEEPGEPIPEEPEELPEFLVTFDGEPVTFDDSYVIHTPEHLVTFDGDPVTFDGDPVVHSPE